MSYLDNSDNHIRVAQKIDRKLTSNVKWFALDASNRRVKNSIWQIELWHYKVDICNTELKLSSIRKNYNHKMENQVNPNGILGGLKQGFRGRCPENSVYLDHAGASLTSETHLKSFFNDLSNNSYANPHTDPASSGFVDQARLTVTFFWTWAHVNRKLFLETTIDGVLYFSQYYCMLKTRASLNVCLESLNITWLFW